MTIGCGRKRRRRVGGSHFSNITRRTGAQRALEGAIGVAHHAVGHLRKHKIISTYLKGHKNPFAQASGHIAGALGFGRRRKRVGGVGRKRKVRRRMRGGDFLGIGNFFRKTIPNAAKTVYNKAIRPAHDFIKKHKLVSRGLALIPHAGAKAGAAAAGALGYGRRRRGGSTWSPDIAPRGRRRIRVGFRSPGTYNPPNMMGGGGSLAGRLYIN